MNYFRHRPNQEDTSVWVVESDLDSHSVFHCMHPPFSDEYNAAALEEYYSEEEFKDMIGQINGTKPDATGRLVRCGYVCYAIGLVLTIGFAVLIILRNHSYNDLVDTHPEISVCCSSKYKLIQPFPVGCGNNTGLNATAAANSTSLRWRELPARRHDADLGLRRAAGAQVGVVDDGGAHLVGVRASVQFNETINTLIACPHPVTEHYKVLATCAALLFFVSGVVAHRRARQAHLHAIMNTVRKIDRKSKRIHWTVDDFNTRKVLLSQPERAV